MGSEIDLHTSDTAWAAGFAAEAELLLRNARGQEELWPIDDLLGPRRYVPCPRRGTHRRLTDCWMCWCDVVYGAASAADVLLHEEP